MNPTKFCALITLIVSTFTSVCSAQIEPAQSELMLKAGDRRPAINCIYPPAAMFGNGKGGTVLDITRAPFSAKGDGKTDDTAALVRAYDFVLREQDKFGYMAAGMVNTNYKTPNLEGYPPMARPNRATLRSSSTFPTALIWSRTPSSIRCPTARRPSGAISS